MREPWFKSASNSCHRERLQLNGGHLLRMRALSRGVEGSGRKEEAEQRVWTLETLGGWSMPSHPPRSCLYRKRPIEQSETLPNLGALGLIWSLRARTRSPRKPRAAVARFSRGKLRTNWSSLAIAPGSSHRWPAGKHGAERDACLVSKVGRAFFVGVFVVPTAPPWNGS